MFVNKKKLMRDLGNAVRYGVGKEKAYDHVVYNEGWTSKQLDEVNWDHLRQWKISDEDNVWLSKKHIGHCGTQVQVG